MINEEVGKPWPKRKTVYLYSKRDHMRELGENIGLDGDALLLFKHALAEVEVVLDINEDGTYTVVSHKIPVCESSNVG